MRIVAETPIRDNDYDALFNKRDWISLALVEDCGVYSIIESIRMYYVAIDYYCHRAEMIDSSPNYEVIVAVYNNRVSDWKEKYKERETNALH